MPNTTNDILNFWFGAPTDPEYGQPRREWFQKDPAFDAMIRARFLATHQQAARGELNDWQTNAESCLALIIVLDQFSRNLFRGTPQVFATDAQALAIAKSAINRGFDQAVLPVQRWFYYLPLEHSENLVDQSRCLTLFEKLRDHPPSAQAIEYAQKHYNVIERFGRFPHRNAILDRASTSEELAFLAEPGSSF